VQTLVVPASDSKWQRLGDRGEVEPEQARETAPDWDSTASSEGRYTASPVPGDFPSPQPQARYDSRNGSSQNGSLPNSHRKFPLAQSERKRC
jgi:hypothetical protein